MRKLTTLTAVFAILCVVVTSVLAETFAVQGVLRDPLGKTVADGSYSMTFRLYTTATGGSAVWTETQGSVSVLHGVYNAELGTVTALTDVAFNTTYYLGLSINGGTELEPRFKLTRTPASMSVLGTDNVFPSKGNVGVGTHTPTATLHIKNKNSESNVLLVEDASGNTQLNTTSSGQVGVGTAPSADLHIKTSNTDDKLLIEGSDGTNYVVVDASGKMGVNVETPAQALDIDGNLKVRNGGIMFDDGSTLTSADMGGSASSVSNQSSTLITADSDENGSGNIDLITGSTTRMTVNSNGNVGIGTTTTPAYKLDVNGNVNFNGSLYQNGSLFKTSPWSDNTSTIYTTKNIAIGTSTSSYPVYIYDSDAHIYMSGNGYSGLHIVANSAYSYGSIGGYSNNSQIRLHNNGDISVKSYYSGSWSDPLYIKANGKVGIGTITPEYDLHVQAPSGESIAYFKLQPQSTTSGSAVIRLAEKVYIQAVNGSTSPLYFRNYTTGGYEFALGSSATNVLKLTHGNGSNYASYDGDSNWDFTSDRRLKENINPELNILERVLKLDVVNFNFKDNPNKTKEIGFIAQDVEPYFPTLITEQDDQRYDFKVKSLGYTTFGVLAVGAVKELNQKVEDLKEELNKKDAIINDLLKRVEALEKQ